MERINLEQLNSVLTAPEPQSLRRLSDEDSIQLFWAFQQTVERYPGQEIQDSAEGFIWDLERLAMRYSPAEVIQALADLRIRPGQRFLPRPDEVAEEVERGRDKRAEVSRRKRQQASDEERDRYFWEQVLPHRMATTGETEEQVLARYPSIWRREQSSDKAQKSGLHIVA